MQQNINSAYLNTPQQNFQAYQPGQAQQAVADGVKKIEDNNTVLKHTKSAQNNMPLVLGGGAASMVGMSWISSLINKQLRGNYEDTVFGKIESGIDKHLNKPEFNKSMNKIGSGFKWVKNKLIAHSEIARNILERRSLGGPQPQSQAAGMRGHIANMSREFMKIVDAPIIAENILLKKAGLPEKPLIFGDVLARTESAPHKYHRSINNAIKRAIKEGKVSASEVIVGESMIPMPKFMKQTSTFGEILNKYKLIDNYKKCGKTAGARISGILFRGLEGLTNGMTGGKLAILGQAFAIGMSLNESLEAPKGERFKKFTESLFSLMAFMLTMGISVKLFDAVGGMKFIGMNKENYKRFHNIIKEANAAAKIKDTATYAARVNELNAIKAVSKPKHFWQRPFKAIAKFLTGGRLNETIRPLNGTNPLKNAWNWTKYGAKFGGGFAMRFGIIGFGIVSIFSGIAEKISHLIFGKPNIPEEKEGETTPAEEPQPTPAQSPENTPTNDGRKYKPGNLVTGANTPQNPQAAQNMNPQQGINPQAQPGTNPNSQYPQGNLVNPASQGAIGAQSLASQPIGAQKLNADVTEQPEVKRTYIPNPVLGVEPDYNLSESRTARIDAIMRQADNAEAQAQKFLNGN